MTTPAGARESRDRVTYGGVTDTYTYNWQGLRTRAVINGVTYRYLYNGERVLQELTDAGAVNATYTTENDSYYGSLLHIQRATGESRFPLYDEIGSARGLVDASGAVTDTYDMDTFGAPRGSTGTTPNPYRFGAAWGYITDPSGFLQLGARYYWPEVGRFVSQDPRRSGRPAPPVLALAREVGQQTRWGVLLPTNGTESDPLLRFRSVLAARRLATQGGWRQWLPAGSSYPYARSNPVGNIDPDGQICWAAVIVLVGGAIWFTSMVLSWMQGDEDQEPHTREAIPTGGYCPTAPGRTPAASGAGPPSGGK